MHLAHSALAIITKTQISVPQNQANHDLAVRYQAYQASCDKFSREIAAIQKYIPGWMPKFSY